MEMYSYQDKYTENKRERQKKEEMNKCNLRYNEHKYKTREKQPCSVICAYILVHSCDNNVCSGTDDKVVV